MCVIFVIVDKKLEWRNVCLSASVKVRLTHCTFSERLYVACQNKKTVLLAVLRISFAAGNVERFVIFLLWNVDC